jgi:scyllo-inositol 2-dehydrogenase (NADP+)
MQILKVALLSYGMSGKVFHAPFLEFHKGFELLGSWERSNKKIQLDYPQAKSYASLEAILNDKNIDLVVVNTPISTHYDFTKKVLLAGKHALVEKAFTTTIAEAQELDALAKAKNLKLAVFHNRRWDSDFRIVQKVLNDSLLGNLVEAEFHFDRFNPLLSQKKHKELPTSGAGILKDLGSHLIDQCLYLFGKPKAVFANIRITRDESKVDDWFDIVLYYTDFNVRIKASFFIREPIPAYVLHGKKGTFLKQREDVQEEDLKAGKKPNLTTWGTEPSNTEGLLHTEINGELVKQKIPNLKGNYYYYFDELYQAITKNLPVPVSAQEGLLVMTVIECALQSQLEKRIIELK